LNKTLETVNDHFSKYRISDALMAIYKLIWDDFCSWYLEMVKPAYQQPVDGETLKRTIGFFEKLLQILHPFMPFITEEIWHLLKERKEGESIMMTEMVKAGTYDEKPIAAFDYAKDVIISLRNFRKERNIPVRDMMKLKIKKNNDEIPDTTYDELVIKLCNLESLAYSDRKIENTGSFIVKTTEFYIPLEENYDREAEIKKLEDELKYQQGFLDAVMKKLSNERFLNNAPPNVLQLERKKQMDAEAKISVIEKKLKQLSN